MKPSTDPQTHWRLEDLDQPPPQTLPEEWLPQDPYSKWLRSLPRAQFQDHADALLRGEVSVVQGSEAETQAAYDQIKEAIQSGTLVLGVDFGRKEGDVTCAVVARRLPLGQVEILNVSLVRDLLPPYGQIHVQRSCLPTDSPRPTSSSDG